MWVIIGLFFAFVIISGWVLPWMNRRGLQDLEQDVHKLNTRLSQIERQAIQAEHTKQSSTPQKAEVPAESKPATPPAPFVPPASPVPPMTAEIVTPKTSVPASKAGDGGNIDWVPEEKARQRAAAAQARSATPKVADAPVTQDNGFELQFGAKLPVWFGGIALAFAGFYLV